MPDENAASASRAAIRTVLVDFVERPFFDVREGDVQARIFSELRARIDPKDVPLVLRPHGRVVHTHPAALRTSRVHREVKLSEDLEIDLAVLDGFGPVELIVHDNGPLDIIAPVRAQDLVVVVEIKAAPSRNMWRAYRDDLSKLATFTTVSPACHAFFVAFDKSLALGGTDSSARPSFAWLDALVTDPGGRIEACWVDGEGHVQTRRGHVGPRTPS